MLSAKMQRKWSTTIINLNDCNYFLLYCCFCPEMVNARFHNRFHVHVYAVSRKLYFIAFIAAHLLLCLLNPACAAIRTPVFVKSSTRIHTSSSSLCRCPFIHVNDPERSPYMVPFDISLARWERAGRRSSPRL